MNNWKEQWLDHVKYAGPEAQIQFVEALLSLALTEAEGKAMSIIMNDDYEEKWEKGWNAHRSHVSEVKKKFNL